MSINNVPSGAVVGGSFTPAYTKAGDGAASTASMTTGTCTVSGGDVSFVAAGTCTLRASVAEGTNHLAADGSDQSFSVAAGSGGNQDPTYTFNGDFLQPVDNLPTPNLAKAGSAIPVKFRLAGGNMGLDIMAVLNEGPPTTYYPASGQRACPTASTPDAIEQTTAAGSSTLTYDVFNNQYVYVWKTDRAWADRCRTLVVRLAGGAEKRALFRFKK